MPRFLLDANLSPKVGRYLAEELQLDVISLHGLRLGSLPDHQVLRLAQEQRRILITQDRDFIEFFRNAPRPSVGIIYIELPNRLRFIPHINEVLRRFFSSQASQIDMEHTLITISESEVRIVYPHIR